MRWLDRGLAGILIYIGREEALLDEVLDQRPRLRGNFRQPGDAATRRAGVGIDASQPGNEAAAQQFQTRGAVPRDRGVRVGSLQRALDRRLDRTLDATECFVIGKRQPPAPAVFEKEPL